MDFKGKNGISIEIITKKIKKELKLNYPMVKRKDEKNKIIKRFKEGKLSSSDWNYIYYGLNSIRQMVLGKIDNKFITKNITKEDMSKMSLIAMEYKDLIDKFLYRIISSVRLESEIKGRMESLYDYSIIAQAARDGIIIKQEEKEEIINGEKKKIKYDTTMTSREVIEIIRLYERRIQSIYSQRLTDYLGIGLGISGIIGTMSKQRKNNDKGNSFIVLKSASKIGTELMMDLAMKKMKTEEKWKIVDKIRDQEDGMEADLIDNEQISEGEIQSTIEDFKYKSQKEKTILNQIENEDLISIMISSLIQAIIMGAYISKNVTIKENGKIDGKSLASALVSMEANEVVSYKIYNLFMRIKRDKYKNMDLDILCEQAQDIISQMEEKVYPLKGVQEPFDSFEIKNLNAKFYPKTDYETGEIKYGTNIEIPEFSMKRGDIVLLSGVSGAGKSTFLRLLKRGDINNRNVIKLDNGREFDNLGNQFISFRPSMDLGNESSTLYQITGKSNVSDLSEREKMKLNQILYELHLDFPNLMEQLSTRKFMEFSTGQQRRLILSKLFYKIDDGASIVIVDEPVGNVEDKLIKEQLEMIKRYAMRKNVMLLLTTHRLDLAENLATKRYHINENGVMEQMEIQNQDKERN